MNISHRLHDRFGPMIRKQAGVAVAALMCLFGFAAGCAAPGPDREARAQRGYVFYLDGAGGGGITNWSAGVRNGLRDGGYAGAGEMFPWETGLGLLADQTATNDFKRGKARKLADEIVAYRNQHPGAPVHLIGLSAGTVISVFALESLPPGVQVNNVILLSGSLSADYDLTAALQHVRGKMYVSTSARDVVLGALLPVVGTADRGADTNATIGVEGPQLPVSASAQSRQLYASKLEIIPWKSEFARYGNSGGHTDSVAAPFVARYIAPLVEPHTSGAAPAVASVSTDLVANPDFERWARYAPGTWVTHEVEQATKGESARLRVKTTLARKSASVLVLKREQFDATGARRPGALDQVIYESAQIHPEEQPLTHPQSTIREQSRATVFAAGQSFDCRVFQGGAPGTFSAWGTDPDAAVHINERIPGGIVKLRIKTSLNGQPLTLSAELSEYYVAK